MKPVWFFHTLLIFQPYFSANALQQQKTFEKDGRELVLKWNVRDTEVDFEVEAETTGFVAFGFAHDIADNLDTTTYDGFVGGIKDGDRYGASYDISGTEMQRNKEDRYQMKTVDAVSESNGRTILKLTRSISTCYWESFDWRDVGDATMFTFTLGDDDDDTQAEKLPNTLYAPSSATTAYGYISLFNQAQTLKDQLEETLPLDENSRKIELFMDNDRVGRSQTLCRAFKTDKTFTHFVGFTPEFSGDREQIRLMMVFQCDNEVLWDDPDSPPILDDSGGDQCRQDLGVEGLDQMCREVLFVWSPGSEGEALPEGTGIQPKTPDDDDERYYLLLIAYHEDVDEDSSGLTLYVDNDNSLTAVAKMMVGHHISSKMIIMPSEEWKVWGVCPASCSGSEEISSEQKISVLGAGLHHRNANEARVRLSQESGEYRELLQDVHASETYQPSRIFPVEKDITLGGASDIVVECTYDHSGKNYLLEGDLSTDQEYCFATLTYQPPIPLATCTSIPTEISLENAFGMELLDYEDQKKKRRRRRRRRSIRHTHARTKRQADALIHEFGDRETMDGSTVSDILSDLAKDLVDDQATASRVNERVLSGDYLPICARSDSDLDLLLLSETSIEDQPTADKAPILSGSQCQASGQSDVRSISETGGKAPGSGGVKDQREAAVTLVMINLLVLAVIKRILE